MSPANRQIATIVLDKPFDAATWTIEGLAGEAGVSPASANRFARLLGFARYADFRQALFAEVRPILAPEVKLASREEGLSPAQAGLATLKEAAGSLLQAAETIPEATFAEILGLLRGAGRIDVLGLGISSPVATFTCHLLEPLLAANMREIAVAGGSEEAARRLHSSGAGDVLIAITLPRYSREAVALAERARDRGVAVIALTDSRRAPIARVATLVATLGAEHRFLPSSAIAAFAFVEALATALAQENGLAARRLAAITTATRSYVYEADPFRVAPRQSGEGRPR